MVALASPLLEPSAPDWAGRFALRLQQFFQPLIPSSPLQLKAFPSTALPAPADWLGCVIYVSDKHKVGLSNGTTWTDPAGGVL